MDSPFFAIINFVAEVTTHLNKAHYSVVVLDSNTTIEDRTGSYRPDGLCIPSVGRCRSAIRPIVDYIEGVV